MTYQTKKCPHCGKVYEKNSYAGNPSKYNRLQYGSPLKICSECKKPFIDDEYREIAIQGVRFPDKMLISPAGIVFSLITLIISIMGFVNASVWYGIIFLAASLYLSLSEMLTYKSRQRELEKLTRESEERMNNPLYAILLSKAGFDVPDRYMPKTDHFGKIPTKETTGNAHDTDI